MTIFRFSLVSAVVGFALVGSTGVAAPKYFPTNFVSASELNESCNSAYGDAEFYKKRAFCDAYVNGIIDAHSSLIPFGSPDPKFCLPVNVVRGQGPRLVAKWLKENSWSNDDFASGIVLQALASYFPCGEKK
ncbi:MAG: Rap1a/Tai family immunity protein [Erythrobacter sp.]